MVKRLGHEPLAIMGEISKRAKITTTDSPPYGITYKEPREALKYCSVDVPSGVRGRINVLAPLVQKAEAAIFVENSEIAFGSSGCARANEFAKHMIRQRNIPILSLSYPNNEQEAETFVRKIVDFLKKPERS
jgi:putative methanogenesis marker protein 5